MRLAWATASEKNSAAFDVERSLDGFGFERLGTVTATGSSNTLRTYGFVDAKLPGAARLYYRLKQVDGDGTFAYSPVRTVARPAKAGPLALFLNPTRTGARSRARYGAWWRQCPMRRARLRWCCQRGCRQGSASCASALRPYA